jgi:hypothetical protein
VKVKVHGQAVTEELVGSQVTQGSLHTAGQAWKMFAERRVEASVHQTGLVEGQMGEERTTVGSVAAPGKTQTCLCVVQLGVEDH